MANKRQRKKQHKKQLEKKIVTLNIPEKEIKQYSYNTLVSIAEKEEKKKKNKQQRLARRNKKIKALHDKGLNPFDFSVKEIDSIKIKDVEKGNFNKGNYPAFFDKKLTTFDFNTPYKLKNGERMYFAFRDFSGEMDFNEILKEFSNMTDTQLLDRLEQIATLRPSYKKGSNNSNGSAGDYKFLCQDQEDIETMSMEVYNTNRRKKTKEHTGDYKGFQVLKNGRRVSYDTVTPRKLMIVANAIMHNVTELDRLAFYESFYSSVSRHIPDFAELLPNPLKWT